jgi:hypothetical protein
MADKKFDQFTPLGTFTGLEEFVGHNVSDNIRATLNSIKDYIKSKTIIVDTYTNFTTNNDTFPAGCVLIEADDLETAPKIKFSSGTLAYNDLPYFSTNLGLIKIVDLDGDFFTDLATAQTYIEQFFSDPTIITNKSFDNGIFFFTVPKDTSMDVNSPFLNDAPNYTNASFIDEFGLITEFHGEDSFLLNKGYHKFINASFADDCFKESILNVEINDLSILSGGAQIGGNSSGTIRIKGNIGTSEATQWAGFFYSSTATIFANASKYTSNAGSIQGDLQTAITNGCNVQFDGINKENVSNKQTDLTPSATKYPNVNAVNAGLATKLSKARVISFSHTTLNPADGNTYFFGSNVVANAANAASTPLRRAYSPLTGFVYAVMINVQVSSTLGSSEGVTFTLNNVTQGTSVVLSTAIVYSIISSGVMVELGTPFAVNANDSLEIKIDMPTFATNPVSVINLVTLYLGSKA